MPATAISRRTEVLSDTLRRFLRRGARPHIANILGKVHAGDLATSFKRLTPGEELELFRLLAERFPEKAGEVLTEVSASRRLALAESLEPKALARILEHAAADDAVYLIESLPAELGRQALALADRRELAHVTNQLTYRDDSAGRIMDPEFFTLPASTTAGEAIASLQEARDVDMIFYLYLTDEEGRLTGVTSLRRLLLNPPRRPLSEIMDREVLRVHTDTDQEEVAQLAAQYDLLAIPVVDDDGRMVGVVTVDDIIDVVKEEATEDFYKLAGTSDDELLYQERSLRVAGIRLPWLLLNLAGLVVTGLLLERFQMSFKEALFLLTFVPVIMGMGGNIGSQTSMIAVRGLATGRLGMGAGRARAFVWQQLKVGVVLGVTCGLAVALGAFVLEQNPWYALVVGCALLLAVVVASANGALVPMLFKRLGIDPAVASAPLVTTSNDVTGILIYFGLAALLIELLIR